MPVLLDLARDVTNARAASFLSYDPKRKVLKFRAVEDESLSTIAGQSLRESIEIPLGEGIAGRIAQQRQPLIIQDAQSYDYFYDQDPCYLLK